MGVRRTCSVTHQVSVESRVEEVKGRNAGGPPAVYLARPDAAVPVARLERYVSEADVGDANRAGEVGGEKRRRDVLRSRAFCRTVLARVLREHGAGEYRPAELPLARDGGGKPSLAVNGRDVAFSVSHTGTLLACAVSLGGRTVGVDVERIDRALRDDPSARATRLFAAREAEDVRARGRNAFLERWTLKEAYLKATGEGIGVRRRLREVTFDYDLAAHAAEDSLLAPVRLEDDAPPPTFAGATADQWKIYLAHLPELEHVMAVCTLELDGLDATPPRVWLTDTLAEDAVALAL